MNIEKTLSQLYDLGIKISVVDDKLRIQSTREKIPKHILFDIKSNKDELINYLKGKGRKSNYIEINNAESIEYYPLSSAQKRLYLLQQMEPEASVYNMPYFISLGQKTQIDKIKAVFNLLILRHESFRTSIDVDGIEPVQRIHNYVDFKVEEFTVKKEEVSDIKDQFIRAFDLSQAPLMRVAIVKVLKEGYILMIDMHHIISDGVSHRILENEFQRLYSGEELLPLRLQYKDYSEWQCNSKHKEEIKGQEDYWIKQFNDEITVLNLPYDFSRPSIQSFDGASVGFTLNEVNTAKIKEICKTTNSTLSMAFVAFYNILLSKLSSQEDIVIGLPIAGRRHADLEKIIGMFVNTLALRNYPRSELTFKEFLSTVKSNTLSAYENQEYQFEDLVEKISVDRDPSRNPIFEVVFNLLNQDDYTTDYLIFDDTQYFHKKGVSKFDLSLMAVDYGTQILLHFEYCTKLFKPETINRFIRYFKNIINQVTEKIENKISDLQIIDESEKLQILNEFNKPLDYRIRERTIHELFEKQAEIYPENIAVIDKDNEFTYHDLNVAANKLAWNLISKGVRKESIVIIHVERSIEFIVGILGIQKSGGCYLPIDKNYPMERKDFMLEDSESKFILVDSNDFPKNKETEVLNLKDIRSFSEKITNPSTKTKQSNLAYLIYTSGSSGKPKGTLLEHKGIVSENKLWKDIFKLNKSDKCLQYSSISFDASVWEIYMSLFNGACLFIPDNNIKENTSLFEEYLINNKITVATLPPAVVEGFSESVYQNLRLLITAGSETSEYLINKVNKNTKYINAYGPTETSVCATYWDTSEYNSVGRISIGRPIPNHNVYITDKNMNLQGIGIPGELCISGIGLARGYLRSSSLTSDKFIIHPFRKDERLYRTGDLACWLPDGNIEFLGRIDNQVKIRGNRIELGEVEYILRKYENIKECAVIANVANNDKYLCAYIVCNNDIDHTELKRFMVKHLPNYMVPSYFVEIDNIPLTINGKINKRVLPNPQINISGTYVAPVNSIEEKLVQIWMEILDIPNKKIGTNDNFFSLGGHSLKASLLIGRIHKKIGVQIPLKDIFVNSTIKSQADLVSNSEKQEFVSIPKAKEQLNYPLSSAQKRLYLLQQFDLTSTVYNMPYIIPLGKEVDKLKIEEVFKQLINRHESFRTSIIIFDGEPVQLISKDVDFELEELSIESTEVENTRIKFIRPFDLSKAPFLRVVIVEIKGEDNLLMIDMHHIISDAVSHSILEHEFQFLYDGAKLPELPLQYKDYSVWQNSCEQQEKIKRQEEYWKSKFEEEIPVLNLPTDYQRPLVQSFEGATVSFSLSKEDTLSIKTFAKENELTLYMAILSIFNILISKLSGEKNIVVGTPISARNHVDLENIVGMFVNTLAIRNEVKGEETLREFLAGLKRCVLEGFENQDFQFENLVEKVSIQRNLGRNPVFDIMFNLLNQEENKGILSDFDNSEIKHKCGVSKFDLTLTAVDYGEQILLSFEYCTKLFKPETIERLIKYFQKIVDQIVQKTDSKISEIEIISVEEKQQLLYDFNNTKVDYPRNKTIYQLFDEQATRTPDNIAVCTRDRSLNYNELQRLTEKLAKIIWSKGVLPGSVVGLMVDRSIEMIIGLMGILRSGCCYLPIMPKMPKSRFDYVIKDSESPMILTQTKYKENLGTRVKSINLEELESLSYFPVNLPEQNDPNNLAYIIYTSGTTGNPKGVMIENHSVVNRIKWMQKKYPIGSGDVILQKTPYTFDVSVWELFWWSFEGASVYMLEPEGEKDPYLISKTIGEKKINVMHFVPSMLETFLNVIKVNSEEYNLGSMKYVFSSGEALKPNQVRSFYNLFAENVNTKLVNLYGPTEATVDVSVFECLRGFDYKNIPIGRPIDNIQLYVLDSESLNLRPVGVVGELMISGVGLSRGYMKKEGLTSEKFISHPFKAGKRLYRTGDLARWLPDGNIEFLGRMDHQVKIRGFRIELGEIENVLLKHEKIKESVVLAREEHGDKSLCAYIVTEGDYNEEGIRNYLFGHLPDYMIPSYFVELDEIPLTSNGKVNHKALPSPEVKAGDDYIGPSNDIEERLVEVWSEVLNINKEVISVNSNFFELGGNSLSAIKVVGKLIHDFEITLRDIFLHNTVIDIALHITRKEEKLKERIKVVKKSYKINMQAPDMSILSEKIQKYKKEIEQEVFFNIEEDIDYENILLTGATGYLGIHILYELLQTTNSSIYLIIRGENNEDAELRLKSRLSFYFGKQIFEESKKRLYILKGDLTKDKLGIGVEQYEKISTIIDAVIHSAANVSHYGQYEILYKDNVKATERLLKFALKSKNKRFNYISTISVCKGEAKNNDSVLFTEYHPDEVPKSDNIYISTKQEAESKILQYRKKGVNASIYRVGNLTFHSMTGKFQKNIEENAFYSRLKEYITLGYLPIELVSGDFSFIDYTAKSIILLMTRKSLNNETYHLYNNSGFKITLKELSKAFKQTGIKVKSVSQHQFFDCLLKSLGNKKMISTVENILLHSGLLEDKKNEIITTYVSDRTNLILNHLGFEWPKLNYDHIHRMLRYCKKVKFL